MARYGRTAVLQHVAAGATAVVIGAVVWTAFSVIDGVYDNYTCEALNGYNPSGATTAERYPPDTWAGLCEKNESGAVMLYSVLAGIGAVALGGVFVAIVRS